MQSTTSPSPKLTTPEVCRRWRVTPRTLKSWRDRGILPFIKIGERTIRYDADEVEKALRRYSAR